MDIVHFCRGAPLWAPVRWWVHIFAGRAQRPAPTVLKDLANKQSGFTMIEILLVLMLIGLFTAATAPRLIGAIKNFDFNRDLANLQKVLRYAQYHAVLEGKVYELDIDQSEKTYALRRQINTENFDDFEPIKIASRTMHRLSEGTDIMGGRSEIYFFPDGSMSLPFRILLQNIHGPRVEITNKGLGLFKITWQHE